MDDLRQWIGRRQAVSDTVTPVPIAALSATLDRDDPAPAIGDDLPPLWHWLYFLPIFPISQSGPDGHFTRGAFLPPVPLPRRMWAGSRFEFHRPLCVGESITRTSTIADVASKEGRSGPLVFVLVRHDVTNRNGHVLTEEHDIVYREMPKPDEPPASPQRAPDGATWSRQIHPDPVLLFRYSALTFNSHRIHYDRRYVTEVERYPGLVVHGPLIATLLLDLLRRNEPRARLARFSFHALRPLFDTAPFAVCGRAHNDGRTVQLWAEDAEGWLAMDATATLV